eukprot:362942-Chlamydomonas_euryale.AAC.12
MCQAADHGIFHALWECAVAMSCGRALLPCTVAMRCGHALWARGACISGYRNWFQTHPGQQDPKQCGSDT